MCAQRQSAVWGRGDGSFVNPKFTGIAVFVAPELLSISSIPRCFSHSFGKTEGSKGSSGVVLRIGGVTIAAVSCHLASKKTLLRLAQYKDVCKIMGAKLCVDLLPLCFCVRRFV